MHLKLHLNRKTFFIIILIILTDGKFPICGARFCKSLAPYTIVANSIGNCQICRVCKPIMDPIHQLPDGC